MRLQDLPTSTSVPVCVSHMFLGDFLRLSRESSDDGESEERKNEDVEG